MDAKERERLAFAVGKVFTPTVPVSEEDLFAGRIEEIRKVVDVINQRGQHAIIFGERGVGKSSLANIISSKLTVRSGEILAPRINCDSTDTFHTIWKKIFSQVDLIRQKRMPGFQLTIFQETVRASEVVGENIAPDDVRRLITLLGDEQLVVIIFDEFDRLPQTAARRAMADTIKAFSDHDVRATIVLVGVGDTVDELISEHESIERALVQVPMPRMVASELHEFLDKGLLKLGMTITGDAKEQIALLSQGLPNYTHLIALHATRKCIDEDRLHVTSEDVYTATRKAVGEAQQSLRAEYRKAINSPQRGNIYSEVLVACALAKTDPFGYFFAGDIRQPLSAIRHKPCAIPSFSRHLNEFCHTKRGAVLRRQGAKHNYTYRFSDPLMQPLVIMQGLVDGKIDEFMLKVLHA
jgi:hypothetical protein